MAARHRSRKRALQVLFEWDQRRDSIDGAIRHYYETLYSEEQEKQPEARPVHGRAGARHGSAGEGDRSSDRSQVGQLAIGADGSGGPQHPAPGHLRNEPQ